MINPHEFVRQWQDNKLVLLDRNTSTRWGAYEFVKYDSDSVDSLVVSRACKSFLIDAGLPKRAWWNLRFETPYPAFIPITELESEWATEYQRYRFVALNGFVSGAKFIVMDYLCLDEQAYGQVVQISLQEDNSVTFVNSSIIQLAEYLLVLRQHLEWQIENRPLDDDILMRERQVALDVGNRLREIDLAAAENKEHWGRVIDEIEALAI